MDTTLITFMIHTPAATHSVQLIGSWDNFKKRYPMERDVKRSRGQWKGCHAFEDIIYDGSSRNSSKRAGGLRMGSTYYYYYELDNGTDHYDTSIPFTTSCPYLPGQPVNLLFVPTEVEPARLRSASMTSLTINNLKTMNPADKFMAPRRPPPLPQPSRLNTSPSSYSAKRTARSLSPKVDRQWSARSIFGMRSPLPINESYSDRGRSSSLSRSLGTDFSSSTTTLAAQDQSRKQSPIPSRSSSPSSSMRARSRDPSPLRRIVAHEPTGYDTTTFIVPDEITEEPEDDENFASDAPRKSLHEKGLHTQLSPPPSARPMPSPQSLNAVSKPLPDLPSLLLQNFTIFESPRALIVSDGEAGLIPNPLQMRPSLTTSLEPRSHFSVSTIATTSSTSRNSITSMVMEADEEGEDTSELTADLESGDECNSPVLDRSPVLSPGGFSGYSLPSQDCASAQTLRKYDQAEAINTVATRRTFGGTSFSPLASSRSQKEDETLSAMELLISEIGYLGDIIVRR